MYKRIQTVVADLFKDRKLFIFSYLASIIFYSLFFTNQLTNTFDSVWHPNISVASSDEIAVGRWVMPYLDRLHLGMQTEPFVSLFTLLFICISVMMIVDMFEIKGILAYFISIYIITGTAVTCILSYRYTAVNYGLCALLAVATVWFLVKEEIGYIRYILSSFCLIISLGIYQADIAVTAILLTFKLIHMAIDNKKIQEISIFTVKAVFIVVVSCIAYRLLALFNMQLFNVNPISYNGADSISISGMILALPQSIIKCYKYFYSYFFTGDFLIFNIYQHHLIFRVLFLGFSLLIILLSILKTLKEKAYVNFLIIIVLLLLLPICSSFSLVLAPKAGLAMQMTFSFGLIFPCLLSSMTKTKLGGDIDLGRIHGIVIVCVIFFFTFGNAMQSNRDMISMYEGREATRGLINRIVDNLIQKDLLRTDKQYVFLGRPADNDLFHNTSEILIRSNSYAKYGEYITDSNCMNMAYEEALRNTGVDISVCDTVIYDKIKNSDIAKNMPEFPMEGSIQNIDEYVIIKVADY